MNDKSRMMQKSSKNRHTPRHISRHIHIDDDGMEARFICPICTERMNHKTFDVILYGKINAEDGASV